MSKKKKTVCLEDSQIKRLAHDSYIAGKHGINTDGLCETVKDIVKDSTTEEERLGTYRKKKDKTDPIIDKVSKKVLKSVKSKLGALGDFF